MGLQECIGPAYPEVMIRRVIVERRPGFREAAEGFLREIRELLGLHELSAVHQFQRYDVSGVSDAIWETALRSLFSEEPVEITHGSQLPELGNGHWVGIEYLPGQFDQRADSAEQCLRLLGAAGAKVRCASLIFLGGQLSEAELGKVRDYVINPVDSREASFELPDELEEDPPVPQPVRVLVGFGELDSAGLEKLHREFGLAMSLEDLAFCRETFSRDLRRDPTLTEIKLLDTYWSDHCRHTTFLSEIEAVEIQDGSWKDAFESAWQRYLRLREEVYGPEPEERPVCLMDIALMGMKALRKRGQLSAMEDSEEHNAASIVIPVTYEDGSAEPWLLMFKNETHNHPTEIEPFGGAATCLGGAIRDPLSGRSYVYQAMRITGSGDPRVPLAETLPGKLPQRKITVEAAEGYSSYGNQIGIATGCVREFYHPRFVAKRMEIGAVIAAAPQSMVRRERPVPGDKILLVGGRTGRDGVGGATGSSKAHDEGALANSAEVQKGDAPTERKLQRLFRNEKVSRSIKRCNDFGAGGVSVAIGELADSLRIDLDAVRLKYTGLDGTEIALSESQERMAVVLDPQDVDSFIGHADIENLEAIEVAEVTDDGHLRMFWKGIEIVAIPRVFLDTNGVRQRAKARICQPEGDGPLGGNADSFDSMEGAWHAVLSRLNVCSQRGLVERFDSSIGAGTVLHPFGGKGQATPPNAMAALLPGLEKDCRVASLMSYGYHPEVACWSPFHGAIHAVVEAMSRLIASGGVRLKSFLTFQEYFERLRGEPERWGKPLAALLGALEAQEELQVAAIGGKDSMSGSFEDMDVPPTLVAFGVCPVPAERVRSPEFKSAGRAVGWVPFPESARGLPDWKRLREIFDSLETALADESVVSAMVVGEGGIAAAVAKMAFGNRIGFASELDWSVDDWIRLRFGGWVIEFKEEAPPAILGLRRLGKTLVEPVIRIGDSSLNLSLLQESWESPLEDIFPTRVEQPAIRMESDSFSPHQIRKSSVRIARPRVLIPVFPGTNCEYDSARAFKKAGAEVQLLVFRNLHQADIEASLTAMVAGIEQSQILMLAGGFSAGDEPAGAGKFIAAVLREQRVAQAIRNLLHSRDGLILGICNGFQALLKSGFLPMAQSGIPDSRHPTLTRNLIDRHVSSYVRTRVVSRLSPWLNECPIGAEYRVPVSHGEGRFVAPVPVLQQLFLNDQVATQYVDETGAAAAEVPFNPNGSMAAIEGITSPCGRIFGKMAHSERAGPFTALNIPGEKEMPIFQSGVRYFLG